MTVISKETPALFPVLMSAPAPAGMDDHTQGLLDRLIRTWARKYPRNVLRQTYLDAKTLVRNLNIAISDEIAADLQIVSGWPEKAVYALANMCMWDGPVAPSGSEDPFELSAILDANRFDVELSQMIVSSMAKSVAFVSTTVGDVASGEPAVMVMPHSAEWSAALWDRRRRELEAALVINDTDDLGRPTALTVLTAFEAVSCENRGAGWFVSDVRAHGLRRVPVEAFPFRPSLERPFGRARISRPVMTITDRAIRAALRAELSGELFTIPGLLLNGVNREQFEEIKKSWSWRVGSLKGLTRDENDELAAITQLPQASQQPHVDQMRTLAAEFSGVTSLPLSSLGIVQDNPESADAIYAAKEEIVIEAHNATMVYGHGLNRIYQNVVMMRDGLDEMPEELARISTRWRNPAMPSIVSQSDAMVKQISAIPDLAKTDVALEEMGYTREQILRIRSQIRRSQASDVLARLYAGDDTPGQDEPVREAEP
ncbi:MAG: phage portal protein [Actinomycetaceae bacterium]|nr:phage portal protein [Actinomycetaceae bacterium]